MISKSKVGILPALILALLVHCGGGRTDAPLTPLEPLVTSQPQDQTVKAPAAATFTATVSGNPAPACQWTLNGVPIDGATSSTYTTPRTDSTMTGQVYALTATSSLGSVTSAPAVLTVNGPPVITLQPADTTAWEGGTATFTVTAAGTGGLAYEWYKGGSAIDEATGASYTTRTLTSDMDKGLYSVKVTNPSGSAFSLPATLTVAFGPTITLQPATRNVKAPGEAEFKVTAKGNPLAYQWHRNGTPIAGATEDSWTVPVTAVAMNGDVYTVTVTCADRSVTSDPAVLNVSGAPVITSQPGPVSILAGAPFSLKVEAVGVPSALTYQWSKDGDALNGATAATYTVARATSDDSGSYSVTVTNAADSTESRKARVTVAAGYTVSGTVTAGDAPVEGATLTLGTNPARTAITNAEGTCAFQDVPPGTYSLTPSIAAFSSVFTPAAQSVTVATGDVTARFTATLGYTVSGVLTGLEAGTTYLSLRPAGGGPALGAAHLDLGSGNAFTFKGVQPGTYTLSGRTDLYGKGLVNAHDPAGTLALPVTVARADVTGLTLGLASAAPDLSSLPGPAFLASPMDSGVVIDYAPVLAGGVEQPRLYQVDWSTDPAFASLAGTRRLAPSAEHLLVLSSDLLVNGTTYHFRMRGLGPATATAWSAPATVTVGAGAGFFTASGSVAFATPPSGPLLVGLRDPASGQAWMTRIKAPASPQPFAITGVPASAPGAYQLVAFLDQDLDGRLSFGDAALARTVAVAGDLAGLAPALPAASCTAEVATLHTQPGGTDVYTLVFTLRDGVRHVASALVTLGPNLPVPASLGTNGGGTVLRFEATATDRPAVGDTYTIQATFHDGTTQTLTAKVTGVLDAFASLGSPSGTGGGDLEPDFAWSAPPMLPGSVHYDFTLAGAGVSWVVRGLPQGTASLAWSLDPGNPANTVTGGLAEGVPCTWTLSIVDDLGNAARMTETYTP